MRTTADCEALHAATLQILRDVGVRIEHDEIAGRLLAAGARPGPGPQEIRFPPEMVAEYLAHAPRRVDLAGRDGSTATLTPDTASVFWTCPPLYVWTGTERREAVSADLADVARLCDHLEHVQGVMGMAVADVPPPCRDFTGLRLIAENSRRHARVLCFTPTGMEALLAMKPVFPGNWFSIGFTAHGPLRWTHLALEIFLRSAGQGVPVTINGEPMAGVSGPVTLAGSVAVGNAEILAGIVVNQLLEPGRPVIYNLGLAHVFDMRHATAVTGGPENALLAEASAALGRFYGLPSASWASTESICEDEQAALEKMFNLQAHMAAGVGLIWGLGQLESELTISLAQLLIDNEMIGYIRRFRAGIAVNPETLALDLVKGVGITGDYLQTDHTLEHFRGELFEPQLLNRRRREDNPLPLPEAARARVQSILEADREPKIGTAEQAELRRIEALYTKKLTT